MYKCSNIIRSKIYSIINSYLSNQNLSKALQLSPNLQTIWYMSNQIKKFMCWRISKCSLNNSNNNNLSKIKTSYCIKSKINSSSSSRSSSSNKYIKNRIYSKIRIFKMRSYIIKMFRCNKINSSYPITRSSNSKIIIRCNLYKKNL